MKGGGAWVESDSGSITLQNNIFQNNTGNDGGGAYVSCPFSSRLYVINNTFYANEAYSGGSLFVSLIYTKAYIYNNIFWQNIARAGGNDGDDVYIESDDDNDGVGAYVYLYYNDFSGHADFDTAQSEDLVVTVTDHYQHGYNMQQNPQFVDTAYGDFHLQAGSPCIDAGDNGAPSLPDTDFEGDDRIIDGDLDGAAIVDIGADEYIPNQPPTISSFTADPTSGNAPLTVNFTCEANDPDGSIVSYKWDFDGDGNFDQTTNANTTHTYNSAGTYQATCTVVDNDGAQTTSDPITININTAQNQPPTITSFTADPTSGNAPLEVNFNCQASDPDGEIVSYEIDFGEGEKQTNSSGEFTYTYFKAGTYEVTCWAEDDCGAKTSQTIQLNLPKQTIPNEQIMIDDTATYQSEHAWIDVGDELVGGVFPATANVDLIINLPAFEGPVDVYIGINIPELGLYVLNADNQLEPFTDFSTTPAYRIGTTEGVRESILQDLPICAEGNNLVPPGEYWVYVFVVPTNGGHLDQIDFSTDPYYLYFYHLIVPICPAGG